MFDGTYTTDVCQRWHKGRASYRLAGEPIDTTAYAVEPIDEKTARTFVLTHHYSASYPAARFRAGLFRARPFRAAELCGVAVFSVPEKSRGAHMTPISHFPSGESGPDFTNAVCARLMAFLAIATGIMDPGQVASLAFTIIAQGKSAITEVPIPPAAPMGADEVVIFQPDHADVLEAA